MDIHAFEGSELEQEAWSSCFAMLNELDEVFPYHPLPNYLWIHTTGSVLWVMRREREVYMQGIESASLDDEDVDMGGVSKEGVIPKRSTGSQVPEQRGPVPSEIQLPSVEVPSETVRGERVPPKVIRTYSKKSSREVTSGIVGTSALPTTPRQWKVILTVSKPTLPHHSISPIVPPLPLPLEGDHSSDEDYLDK